MQGPRAWLLLAVVCWATGQDGGESQAERYLRLAREGSPVVRPQAARRLATLGEQAVEVLLIAAGEGPDGLAQLGPELVGVCGSLDSQDLRLRLWQALDDLDFPWRPAAARSLREHLNPAELERWSCLASDRLAIVRVEAIDALAELRGQGARPMLEKLLDDQDDRVRRAAARELAELGETWALAWLIADLERDDHFFERDTGRLARVEAARFLRAFMDRARDLRPELSPRSAPNPAVIQDLRTELAERCGDSLRRVPVVHGPPPEAPTALLGLSIRSCRRGEFDLRLDGEDRLWIGTGALRKVQLPPGTTTRLLEFGGTLLPQLGDRRSFGSPGCDSETLWIVDPAGQTLSFVVSKGPEAAGALRPEALGRILALWMTSLDQEPELRDQIEEALIAVGGSVD